MATPMIFRSEISEHDQYRPHPGSGVLVDRRAEKDAEGMPTIRCTRLEKMTVAEQVEAEGRYEKLISEDPPWR